MLQSNERFLGRGWAFPPNFSADDVNGVEMVEAREDIEQSLMILLNTSLGERVMLSKYGCNLSDYQFEPLSASVIGYIRDMVSNAILYFEPRIKVNRIYISPDTSVALWEGKLTIEVDYTIQTSNTRFNFVYDFYINEVSKQFV